MTSTLVSIFEGWGGWLVMTSILLENISGSLVVDFGASAGFLDWTWTMDDILGGSDLAWWFSLMVGTVLLGLIFEGGGASDEDGFGFVSMTLFSAAALFLFESSARERRELIRDS